MSSSQLYRQHEKYAFEHVSHQSVTYVMKIIWEMNFAQYAPFSLGWLWLSIWFVTGSRGVIWTKQKLYDCTYHFPCSESCKQLRRTCLSFMATVHTCRWFADYVHLLNHNNELKILICVVDCRNSSHDYQLYIKYRPIRSTILEKSFPWRYDYYTIISYQMWPNITWKPYITATRKRITRILWVYYIAYTIIMTGSLKINDAFIISIGQLESILK